MLLLLKMTWHRSLAVGVVWVAEAAVVVEVVGDTYYSPNTLRVVAKEYP